MSAPEKKDEDNKPKEVNIYEIVERQQKQLDALTQAILALGKSVESMRAGGGGGGGDLAIFKEIFGNKKSTLEDVAATAEGFARVADALEHFRKPVLPYSPSDRFLMRAGARMVHKIVYEGVKKKSESSEGAEPSDKDIDKMLGFGEAEAEGEETEHVK